jgi:N-acetylneuraminic acid mutarotase
MDRRRFVAGRPALFGMALVLVLTLVAGGMVSACGGSGGTAWTELSPTGPTPDPRSGAAMAYDLAGGDFLLFGGWDPDTDFGDTWAYDPVADTWTDLAPAGELPAPRALYQMVYDEAGGWVILFGGTSDAGRFGDTWQYDPAANAWSEVAGAGAPEARSAHAMVYLDDAEAVLLFGGVGESGRFADTWAFTPGSGTWTALEPAGSVPSARSGHAVAYDSVAGAVILFGGYDGGGLLNDTWAYDPTANTWSELSPSGDVPSARGNHRMVFDAGAGRVLLFGGFDGNTELDDTWAYDTASNTWNEVQVEGNTPVGREEHALVYDPHAGRVLLFGGFDDADTDLNDLWALTIAP